MQEEEAAGKEVSGGGSHVGEGIGRGVVESVFGHGGGMIGNVRDA